MKSKLLFLLFALLFGFSYVTLAQEEEESEEPTPVISKAQQKKLEKEAATQGKAGSTTPAAAKSTPAPAPAAKTTPAANSSSSNGNGGGDAPSNGSIGTVIKTYNSPNKSSDPAIQFKMDSVQQGNLNIYRPRQDTSWVAPKDIPQARDFNAGNNPFSAKPRNMIELGLTFGIPYLGSDLPYKFMLMNEGDQTYGIGISMRKALGYVFSIRGGLYHGVTYGDGWKGSSAIFNNKALIGSKDYNPDLNYYDQAYNHNPIFLNYKMTYTEGNLVGLINFNNIKFHKERTWVSPYALVGLGLLYYNTRMDQLDANGKMYDYNIILQNTNSGDNIITRQKNEAALYSLWDGSYESQAEQDVVFRKKGIYRYRADAELKLGFGVSFRLNRKLAISLETSNAITGDDLLDGQRWQEHEAKDPSLSPNPDMFNFTSIGINYSVGNKSAEPLWWINPNAEQMLEINETKNRLAKIPEFTDSDDDGVIDVLDREPNTPEGCPVDTHGVSLDSDKDGIPDCRDKEPFSIPGAKVDNEGVSLNKQPEINVDSLIQLVRFAAKSSGNGGGGSFPGWYLPMIHFDLDKDFVKPDYYPELYHIAQVLKMYPKMRVYIDGHTDIRNSNQYNEDLSRRRAINVRNFLIKNYGIEEDRLMLRYLGESTNLIKDLPDRFDARYEREQYMNRRVEFTIDLESMKE